MGTKPRTPPRTPKGIPFVPTLHLVLILVTAFFITIGFMGHLYRPDDQLAVYLVMTGIGALLGKLSNGFGEPVKTLLGKSQNEEPADGENG